MSHRTSFALPSSQRPTQDRIWRRRSKLLGLGVVILLSGLWPCSAADFIQLTADNYQQLVPPGKEVDAILGDWILRNDKIVGVIAHPQTGRNANMTVRGVGGMLIDLTRRKAGSDQLSCFYLTGGRYRFKSEETFRVQAGDSETAKVAGKDSVHGSSITVMFSGTPVAEDGTVSSIKYTLRDGQDWIDYSVRLRNPTQQPRRLVIEDSLRCDGNLFETSSLDELRLFYAEDRYFGQCYGIQFGEGTIARSGGRNMLLRSSRTVPQPLPAGGSLTWTGAIACSQGLPGIRSWAAARESQSQTTPVMLKLQSPQGPIAHANIEILQGETSWGGLQSSEQGLVHTELLPGEYRAVITAVGHLPREFDFDVGDAPRADTLSFQSSSRVRAQITDGQGHPIAAKVQFIGREGTESPDFGPDSAIAAIKNTVYCAHGQFEQPIDPGRYSVIISHGPEHDAEFRDIEVVAGRVVQLTASLPRTVQTVGWISADFHSHSTPSGDNVSHQTGRVLNLLAEHIEFAPCTEHNRIDTYADDLALLEADHAMATCTGIELTGSPLPINHQNAFPLHRHPHQQDGGGPTTDANPVTQIERLTLWDNASSKVVQTNHPNVPQILGDRDLNGKPDEGFRGMLGWMDVIEVHPPEGIFASPTPDVSPKDKFDHPIFGWLQLLNLGYRITGVVNTDAHYNFHGSGWLRNYLRSSTDAPAEISVDEMIASAEGGQVVMTTGPFLEAEMRSPEKQTYMCGSDIAWDANSDEQLELSIRVQCPNWFDVNRVQVFLNGRAPQRLNFTRKSHPQLFADNHTRFRWTGKLPKFTEDTHVIVATIGEGLKLGPVMGEQRGELPPVAVTNPFFVDTDGGGFQANGDDLGVLFMLPQLDD